MSHDLFSYYLLEVSVSPVNFLRGPGFVPQIKLNLAIVMLKRVCAIVVIVVSHNPVLYQFYMCEGFVLARKCAAQ